MKITHFSISPVNGAIVALGDDGSMWIRDGQVAAADKAWRRLPDPAVPTPTQKDNEDDITTTV